MSAGTPPSAAPAELRATAVASLALPAVLAAAQLYWTASGEPGAVAAVVLALCVAGWLLLVGCAVVALARRRPPPRPPAAAALACAVAALAVGGLGWVGSDDDLLLTLTWPAVVQLVLALGWLLPGRLR